MAKRTTVKAIALGYRDVGTSGDYTPLMGVLKGLTVAQDEPDSTEIEAEFYDSPFDIFYDGNPVTMTFELANYDLGELDDLFGGAYDDTNDEYEAASNAFTSEHEWKLDFGRGNASLVIYKGLTIGTLKKDADGALNYSVTITALIYNDGENDHMYKIVGSSGDTPSPTPTQLFYTQIAGVTYVCDQNGNVAYSLSGTIKSPITYTPNNHSAGKGDPTVTVPLMDEPIVETTGSALPTFEFEQWTFNGGQYAWTVSPALEELS